MKNISITGKILQENNLPILQVSVTAIEQSLRSSNELGTTLTELDGSYKIEFDESKFKLYRDVTKAVVVVQVKDINKKIIAQSPPIFKLDSTQELIIKISSTKLPPVSDYIHLKYTLETKLKEFGDVKISDLGGDDFVLLSGVTGKSTEDVEMLNVATKLESTTKIPASILYALFRDDGTTNMDRLLSKTKADVKRTIEKSVSNNIIPKDALQRTDEVMLSLSRLNIQEMLTEKPKTSGASLGELMNIVSSDTNLHTKIFNSYANYDGKTSDFWEQLKKEVDNPQLVTRTQKVLQLSAFSGNQPEIIKSLIDDARYNDGPTLQGFAKMDSEDWLKHIETVSQSNRKLAVPATIPGKDENEKKNNYAKLLERLLSDAFPTTAFVGRLEKKGDRQNIFSKREDAISFFKKNPGFDLLKDNLIISIKNKKVDIDGIQDREMFLKDMKAVQRIFRLTSDFSAVEKLRIDKIDAAHKIIDLPVQEFSNKYAETFGGPDKAEMVYKKAQSTYDNSVNLMMGTDPNQNFSTGVTDAQLVMGDPDLRSLFGSLEQCDCEHCQSVYSPSAYFVDMLKFLKDRAIGVYNELVRRRPDLLKLELTCKNVNTPLPYVDLVNELLEKLLLSRISPAPNPVPPSCYQTASQPKEIAANPEHAYRMNVTDPFSFYDGYVQAYDVLKKAVYPSVLPFNFAVEESRIYFQHLGGKRRDLLKSFLPINASTSLSRYHFAAEWFGFSKEAADIAIGTTTGDGGLTSGAWNFFGFNAQNITVPVIDPADSSAVIQNTNWVDALKGRVDVFLQQTGLSYKELLFLLGSYFINPSNAGTRKITIRAKPGKPADTCVLKDLELAGLEQNDLIKIYKIIRLHKQTGWRMDKLDKAIQVLGLNLTAESDLIALAEIGSMMERLSLDTEQVLVLLSGKTIESGSYINYEDDNLSNFNSLFDTLFRNKGIINPLDPVFKEGGVITAATDSQGNPVDIKYSSHLPTLTAALQVSQTDLSTLMNKLTIATSDNMALDKISLLYRNATLANYLQLSVKDFLDLKDLYGTDPFLSYEALRKFLESVDLIGASGITIPQLNYLLRHQYEDSLDIVSDVKEIATFLTMLRTELNKADVGERDNVVIQKLSVELRLSTRIAGKFVSDFIVSIADPTKKAITEFSANAFVSSVGDIAEFDASANPTVFVNLFRYYRLLDKISFLISKFRLTDEELEVIYNRTETGGVVTLQNRAALFQVVDFTLLPTNTSTPVNLELFKNLLLLIKARDTFPFGTPGIFEIIKIAVDGNDSAAKQKWLDGLEKRTHWGKSVEEIVGNSSVLANAGVLNTNFPQDFIKGELLLMIKSCLQSSRQTGLTITQIANVVKPGLTTVDSMAVKNAAKSKHSEEEWYTVAKDLRDPLRELQRKSLVAYAVSHPDNVKHEVWKSDEELYEYMLIDVDMCPCMMTSRTKQAISSVQLYIDRVLLNLEHPNFDKTQPSLTMAVSDVKQWNDWRKLYRVWEANRKVFLYPENWIEPELRDDKSGFFRELEAQLNQNELNDENVEDAYLNYLEKLDTVSRLEIVAVYRQQDADAAIDVTHVVGRTYGQPHKYFYRKFSESEWSAWEKIEGDIDGDHIAMTIWNRRLYLFWLVITEKAKEAKIKLPSSSVAMEPADKYLEIQVGWTERKKGKWTPKRISKKSITTNSTTDPNSFATFRPSLYLQPMDYTDNALALVIAGIGSTAYLSNQFVFPEANHEPTIIAASQVTFNGFLTPLNISFENMRGVRVDDTDRVLRYVDHVYIDPTDPDIDGAMTLRDERTILQDSKKGRYKLVFSGNAEFNPYKPHFFFQDNKNTFFVFETDPEIVYQGVLFDANKLNLSTIDKYLEKYYDIKETVTLPQPPEDPDWGTYKFKELEFGNVTNKIIGSRTSWVDGGKLNVLKNGAIFTGEKVLEPTYQVENVGRIRRLNLTANVAPQLLTHNNGNEVAVEQPVHSETLAAARETTALGIGAQTIFQNGNAIYEYPPYKKGIGIRNRFQTEDRFIFQTHYHAHVKTFIRELNAKGIPAFLNRKTQSPADNLKFTTNYKPTSYVKKTFTVAGDAYPTDQIDFTFGSGYSQYNWELFFHTPMYIANRLQKDQRFAEAQKWYHYIFDPTNTDGTSKQRFWNFKPFYDEAGKQIKTLDDLMRSSAELNSQLNKWEKNPFKPHVIARMRIVAYMKNVVMKYLDCLKDWADKLFTQGTIESINEATQLYVLASKILGKRIEQVPPRAKAKAMRFEDFVTIWSKPEASKTDEEKALEGFSNVLSEIELFIQPNDGGVELGGGGTSALKMPYFGLPKNDKLFGYWDVIADRLFKIRHCMDIEGIERQLPLFEPPIDPAMLVRAAAEGLDLSSAVSDLAGSKGAYRYAQIFQRAETLCNEVKSLGSNLLAALEKRDAESLSLLRSSHEQKLLSAVKIIKENQVQDLQLQIEGLQKTKEVTTAKLTYYNTRPFTNSFEQQHLQSMQVGLVLQAVQGGIDLIGAIMHAIPNIKLGAPTSLGATYGGENLGNVLNMMSRYLGIIAGINQAGGAMSSTLGGYARRMDDWKFQATTAQKEVEQIEKQLDSYNVRLEIAKKEVANQELQIENAQEVNDFYQSKFTNQDLYNWMIGEISSLYFRSYQLAYKLAKQAEKCYRYELGIPTEDADIIQFGYWDSMKKGLLAADKLQHDLKRLDLAYVEKNKREFELTKSVSLALLDPEKLMDLKRTGKAVDVKLPEEIFDLDYSGHYFRRIKSVSLTIPSIVGPYTNVNCTLRLKESSYRKNSTLLSGTKYERSAVGETRFVDSGVMIESIATSNGQNDSGLFEVNFRDERYLPFEGRGVISTWDILLSEDIVDPSDATKKISLRQFDYDTISDVIIQIRYTAREGGSVLGDAAKVRLNTVIKAVTASQIPLARYFSLKHEFPTEWNQFVHPPGGGSQQLVMQVDEERFPFLAKGRGFKIDQVHLFAKVSSGLDYVATLHPSTGSNVSINLTKAGGYKGSSAAIGGTFAVAPLTFSLDQPITDTDIENIYMVVNYHLVQ